MNRVKVQATPKLKGNICYRRYSSIPTSNPENNPEDKCNAAKSLRIYSGNENCKRQATFWDNGQFKYIEEKLYSKQRLSASILWDLPWENGKESRNSIKQPE